MKYFTAFQESRPALVDLSVPPSSHLGSSARWRGWRNTLSAGVLVPNPTMLGENGQAEQVNITLTRPEQHDEREKHRSLANKFCLSEAAMAAWRWLNAEASAEMIRRATVVQERPVKSAEKDDFAKRRADAVGPQRWLHTMKLTLCYMESLVGICMINQISILFYSLLSSPYSFASINSFLLGLCVQPGGCFAGIG